VKSVDHLLRDQHDGVETVALSIGEPHREMSGFIKVTVDGVIHAVRRKSSQDVHLLKTRFQSMFPGANRVKIEMVTRAEYAWFTDAGVE
jgi:hypothetical protein